MDGLKPEISLLEKMLITDMSAYEVLVKYPTGLNDAKLVRTQTKITKAAHY